MMAMPFAKTAAIRSSYSFSIQLHLPEFATALLLVAGISPGEPARNFRRPGPPLAEFLRTAGIMLRGLGSAGAAADATGIPRSGISCRP